MKTTIFNTYILSLFLRFLSNSIMRLFGWQVDGKLPDLPKYVIIGAPHTSNWDFFMFLGVIFRLKGNVKFMGKAELFRSSFGWFFHYCGSIPVDRSKSQGLVEQMVEACEKSRPLHFDHRARRHAARGQGVEARFLSYCQRRGYSDCVGKGGRQAQDHACG